MLLPHLHKVTADTYPMVGMFYSYEKNFEKKSGASHREMHASYTTQECDVKIIYLQIFALLFVKLSLTGGQKQKKFSNFQL